MLAEKEIQKTTTGLNQSGQDNIIQTSKPTDPLPMMKTIPYSDKTSKKTGQADDKTAAQPLNTVENENDVLADPEVTLPDVDSPSTPAQMKKKRIPPRVNTDVTVTISKGTATIGVENQGGGNGTVLLNGESSLTLQKGTYTIALKGVDQTSPGSADKLKLTAKKGKKEIKSSAGFSVAAIPQNWSSIFDIPASEELPEAVGIKVTNKWESDSNDVTDLDQAMRAECVEQKVKTGFFLLAKGNNSDYVAANTGQIEDRHRARPRQNLYEGTNEAQQTFRFKCSRTGVSDIPATNSGFKITRVIRKIEGDPGKLEMQTTKKGSAGSANGYYSDAADADIDKTYPV